jgi:hypothetical protein
MQFNNFKIAFYILMLLLNSCQSQELNKTPSPDFSCPEELKKDTEILEHWVLIGEKPETTIKLDYAGVLWNSDSKIFSREFTIDPLDDWEDIKGGTQSIAEYPKPSDSLSLLCAYPSNPNLRTLDQATTTILLIPFPFKVPTTCTFIRRNMLRYVTCAIKK